MTRVWGLFAALALTLAACDAVRVPGDGRTPPAAPPEIPIGAPGPPPPLTPVEDPYGEGPVTTDPLPDTDTGTGPVTDPVDPTPETDPTPQPDPDTDTETETETGTDTVIPPVDPAPPQPIKFQYYAPGALLQGSGIGASDETVYAPDMVFPIKGAPSFPQSQVWRFGGMMSEGGQCDPRNYATPWQDNFCETRTANRNAPACPMPKVHQGQDIRVGTAEGCRQMVAMRPAKPTLYDVVAAEDGIVQYIGSYSLKLRGTNTGNIYNYLHLNMGALQVAQGDTVTAGDLLGYISNDFGSSPTTFHLHFELMAPVEGAGLTYVPPYMSLVRAYERRENGVGERLENDTFVTASVPILPEGIEIIE